MKKKLQPSHSNTLKDILTQLETPIINKPQRYLMEIDRDYINPKYKKSWKDPGYPLGQFHKPQILKANVLNQWELKKIQLSRRSYSNPKNFKGIKINYHSRQFQTIKDSIYPKQFQKHLQRSRSQYQQNLFKHKSKLYQFKNKQFLENKNMKFNYLKNSLFGFPKTSISQKQLNKKLHAIKY